MIRFLAVLALTLTATVARGELPSASDAVVHQALASGKPVVIDLGARTCNSCKKMVPVLESLSAEYLGRAVVLFIDVRENKGAAEKFRIQMIPTQVFFDTKGREVMRHVGFLDKMNIIKELKAAGLK